MWPEIWYRQAPPASCLWGRPVGSNKGLCTREFIQILIDEIDLPIIVDAGIGRPSQACEAMEMGAAAVMANTAIATAGDVPLMADAFPQGYRSRKRSLSFRIGKNYGKRSQPFLTSYRISSGLGGRDYESGKSRKRKYH